MHLRSTFFSVFTIVFLTFSLDVFSSERQPLRRIGQKTTREQVGLEIPSLEECDATICEKSPEPMRRQGAYADLSRIIIVPPTPSPMAPLPRAIGLEDYSPNPYEEGMDGDILPRPISSTKISPQMAQVAIQEPFNRHRAILDKRDTIIKRLLDASDLSVEDIEKAIKAELPDEPAFSGLKVSHDTEFYRNIAPYLQSHLSGKAFCIVEEEQPHPANPNVCVAVNSYGVFHFYPRFNELSRIDKHRELQMALQGLKAKHGPIYSGISKAMKNKEGLIQRQQKDIEYLLVHLSFVQREEAIYLGRLADRVIADADRKFFGEDAA